MPFGQPQGPNTIPGMPMNPSAGPGGSTAYDINPDSLITRLKVMSDQQLQQFAQMHQDDAISLSLALNESKARKRLRAQQAMQTAAPGTKVNQEVVASMAPRETGIAALNAGSADNIPDGGIAGYADGGVAMEPGQTASYQRSSMSPGMLDFAQHSEPVIRMASGTNPLQQYSDLIRNEALQQGVDPNLAMRLFMVESGGDPNAVSSAGAVGLGQLKEAAAKDMGLSAEERTDPVKNIRASIGYLAKQQQKYGGDPEKALAAYNWGPGNVDKHLDKNQGVLNRFGLPKETVAYLNKLLPISSAQAAPQTAPPTPAGQIPGGVPGQVAPPAQVEEPGFFRRMGQGMGLSEDTMRNLSNLNTAVSGALGATAIPSYLPRATSGIATLGERIYGALSPTARKAKEAETALREAAAVRAAQAPIEAAEAAQAAGAMPGEAALAANAVRAEQAAKAAQLPSAAEKVQSASLAREAQDAANIARATNAARATTQAGATAASPYGPAATTAAPAMPRGPARPESDLERAKMLAANELPESSRSDIIDQAKNLVPPEQRKGLKFSSDDWLMFGLNMLASRDPFAIAAGKAGIATLAAKQEQEKLQAKQALEKAQAKYYEQYAGAIERGAKEKNDYLAAEKMVQDALAKWESSLAGKTATIGDPNARAAEEARLRQNIYSQLGQIGRAHV